MANHIILKSKSIISDYDGNILFKEGLSYKADVNGTMLSVKDEMGCIRHFYSKSQTWKDDKFFKNNFEIVG